MSTVTSPLVSHQGINNFSVIQKLGEGAYSTVFRVKRISDGSEYAMKKVKMVKLSERERQNALNEVRILASIKHTNIIGYKEAFFEDSTSSLCIIMDYADGGDMMKMISNHKKKNTRFTEKELWYFFIQIVRGMKALHDLKILHRDIKCANIFLTKEGIIKLGDLNVSKVAKKGLLHTQTGTPYYASPEVWKDRPYDNRSDVWSLGCVLYEMIMLNPPFRAANMNGLYQKVMRGLYDPIPSMYSKDLQQMVRTCLQVQPTNRPTCDKILAMPSIVEHTSEKLEQAEKDHIYQEVSLLNTIRVPRDLGQITERLPKPQYGNVMRRNKSLPPEQMEKLPEIPQPKKDNLVQIAHKQLFDSNGNQLPNPLSSGQPNTRKVNNGLAHKIYHQRQLSELAIIEEDEGVPPSRAEQRGRSSHIRERPINGISNPRSAQLESDKAKNYIKPPVPIQESRTPHHMKAKALEILIQNQNDQISVLNLPKIQSTRSSESNSALQALIPPSRLERLRRNENLDPTGSHIYMNKDLATPKASLVPIIEKYNNLNNHQPLMAKDLINQSNVASNAHQNAMDILSDVSRISPIRQNYMQQKKILQQVYGAYRYNNNQQQMLQHNIITNLPQRRRAEGVALSVDSHPTRLGGNNGVVSSLLNNNNNPRLFI